nr:YCF48-related protein [uncultured Pseudomonas sp.]
MSEPVLRRTQAGLAAGLLCAPVFRVQSPLARALSLCGLLSVMSFAAVPACAQANAEASAAAGYSVPSDLAQHTLLLDVAHAGKRLVSVGDRGHILYSDDNAATWAQAKVPTKQLLTAVFFVDDTYGWAVGHDAQILATQDGGKTWVTQFKDVEREEGSPFLDVWFKDRDTGFVVGAYGALLMTSDGGKNWEDIGDRLNSDEGYHLNAIVAVKDAGLFIVGELGGMFRSADWGQTWEAVKGPYEGSLFGALGTHEAGTLLVYGLRGHLFRSSDFGDTWERIELNTPNNGPLEFGLADGNLLQDGSIVVVGHGGSVLKSTDGGRTFDLINRRDRLSLAGVAALDNGNLILVGQGGVHVASPTGAELGQP